MNRLSQPEVAERAGVDPGYVQGLVDAGALVPAIDGVFTEGDARRVRVYHGMDMEPRPDLSSTRFMLANPGAEYVTLQPERADFTVTVEPGRYAVEWFGVDGRETVEPHDITVDIAGPVDFHPPLDTEPSVLYLRSTDVV